AIRQNAILRYEVSDLVARSRTKSHPVAPVAPNPTEYPRGSHRIAPDQSKSHRIKATGEARPKSKLGSAGVPGCDPTSPAGSRPVAPSTTARASSERKGKGMQPDMGVWFARRWGRFFGPDLPSVQKRDTSVRQ